MAKGHAEHPWFQGIQQGGAPQRGADTVGPTYLGLIMSMMISQVS